MLWLVERMGHTDYDRTAGVVVRAPTEMMARALAAGPGQGFPDLDTGEDYGFPEALDPDASACKPLLDAGAPMVILSDFRAG